MGLGGASPGLELRVQLPVKPLFCVINGPTRGRHWASAAARAELRRTAAEAGVRRGFAPHQLRHAHAVELAREGVPLIVIQRQLGHSNLGITSIYLQGIDNGEIIETSTPAAPQWSQSTHRSGSDRRPIASAARRAKRHSRIAGAE
jgi:integrase